MGGGGFLILDQTCLKCLASKESDLELSFR